MFTQFGYTRAKTLDLAVQAARKPGSHIHAGGTDLLGCLRDNVFDASAIVSISGIKDLAGISKLADGSMRIGALTTLSEVAASVELRRWYTALAEAAASAASPQLRNQGTIGGNICQRPRCWYFRGDFHCLRKGGSVCYAADGENRYHCIFGGEGCYIVHPSDTAPALVALDARLKIAGPRGSRVVPIGDFFVTPGQNISKENVLEQGEILCEILLPKPDGSRSTYRKVRERGAWDFALASVALRVELEGGRVKSARVVLGGVAPIPWRAPEAERALAGAKPDAESASRAAEAALLKAVPLAQNAYKTDIVRGLLVEALSSMNA